MNVHKGIVADRLVKYLLEAGIAQLERETAEGRYNTLCLRALARAATLLSQKQIVDRALTLLRAAPNDAFCSGVITNIDLPKAVEKLRTIESQEKLEESYRSFNEKEVVDSMRAYANTENHLALCFVGHFQEARSKARSGVRLEEVGDTLAVLGEFDAALEVARDPALERFRQNGILLVLAIELFRRGRIEQSESILEELESMGLDAWVRVHLALGFAGREPWSGYPYPDY